MADEFTDKQAAFVIEYLKDFSLTQAAIRAGYSPRTARVMGQELMEKDEIYNAIQVKLAERMIRTEVRVDDVVRNLLEIVERCMQRAPVMVKDGKDWVQAKDEDGRDIWQFDAKGANQALALLGKHLGMYIEKREITVPQGTGVLAVPVGLTPQQWAAGAEAQQAALVAKPAVAPDQEP